MVVAIAHKILVSIHHMLCQQVFCNDSGDLYLDTRNLIHRLERLGYAVTLTPHPKAALTEMIFMADFMRLHDNFMADF